MIHGQIKPIYGTPLNRNHPLAQGLVAQYLFNEGCGDVVHDACGMNDGKIIGSSPMISVPTAGGTVTQANMRLSCVAGTAFVDFGAADVLTNNIGKLVRITSVTTGLFIEGWIKAAGTGETLDNTELVTNGDFSSWTGTFPNELPTGWTKYQNWVGDANNYITPLNGACRMVISGFKDYIIYKVSLVPTGDLKLRKVSFDYVTKSVSVTICDPDGLAGGIHPAVTFTSTGTKSVYTTSTNHNGVAFRGVSASDEVVDNVSYKQVLTPSTTGVTIVSTRDGSTYSWTTQQTGFHYNDAAGYTYSFPQSGWVSSPQGGALAFDGSNDYVDCGNSPILLNSILNDLTVLGTIVPYGLLSAYKNSIVIGRKTEIEQPFDMGIYGSGGAGITIYTQMKRSTGWKTSEFHHIFSLNNRYHIGIVRKGLSVQAYVNGNRNSGGGETILTGTASIGNGLQIGTSFYGGRFYTNCLISSVSIYNRALSAAEIKYLYTFPYCMYDQVTPAWAQKDYGREARIEHYYQQMGAKC